MKTQKHTKIQNASKFEIIFEKNLLTRINTERKKIKKKFRPQKDTPQ
jgi:hypothetical protein